MNPSPRAETPSLRIHKRQFAWQILVPVIVVAILIILLAVFTASSAQTRTAADISIIWLIMPMLVLALILIALLGGLIYGAAMLLKITPKYTGQAQSFLVAAARETRKAANGSAQPVIWAHQAGAAVNSIFKKK